jgi:dihydrolipoamide dehydrogenase
MYDYDVISIGAGPGGTASAIRSADNGKKVCLIEKRTKNAVGGTCVNRGCIPTKALIASANALAEIRDCKKYGIKVESVSVDMKSVNSKRTVCIQQFHPCSELCLRSPGE